MTPPPRRSSEGDGAGGLRNGGTALAQVGDEGRGHVGPEAEGRREAVEAGLAVHARRMLHVEDLRDGPLPIASLFLLRFGESRTPKPNAPALGTPCCTSDIASCAFRRICTLSVAQLVDRVALDRVDLVLDDAAKRVGGRAGAPDVGPDGLRAVLGGLLAGEADLAGVVFAAGDGLELSERDVYVGEVDGGRGMAELRMKS